MFDRKITLRRTVCYGLMGILSLYGSFHSLKEILLYLVRLRFSCCPKHNISSLIIEFRCNVTTIL